jgi:NADH:ubiquinone oxidoreductase subunit 6 (subunit J)
MADVVFVLAAVGAIAGAIGTVAMRNPFYSVLSLVVHLLSLAALFLLLRAEFLAAAQVIVYAGAVMVLYVFVVAYVGGSDEPLTPTRGRTLRRLSALFGGVLLAEFVIAILGSGLKEIGGEGSGFTKNFGTPARIGELLLTKFLFVFEVSSLLLLVAAVGAVILARKREGLEGPDAGRISVGDLVRGDLGGESGREAPTVARTTAGHGGTDVPGGSGTGERRPVMNGHTR